MHNTIMGIHHKTCNHAKSCGCTGNGSVSFRLLFLWDWSIPWVDAFFGEGVRSRIGDGACVGGGSGDGACVGGGSGDGACVGGGSCVGDGSDDGVRVGDGTCVGGGSGDGACVGGGSGDGVRVGAWTGDGAWAGDGACVGDGNGLDDGTVCGDGVCAGDGAWAGDGTKMVVGRARLTSSGHIHSVMFRSVRCANTWHMVLLFHSEYNEQI